MVADALIYHPTLTHTLSFLSTTLARDKVIRLVQYFARFYAFYLLRTNAPAHTVASFNQLKSQLSLMRKVFRLGKPVEHLKAAALASDSKTMDPIVKALTVGRQLGYAGYLTFDMAVILDGMGVRRNKELAKRAGAQSYKFWVAGLLFSVMKELYALNALRAREAKVDNKDGEGVVESKKIALERHASRLQLVSDACDLTIPLTGVGWVKFDDGLVGLAGVTSSLIAMWAQWKKTA